MHLHIFSYRGFVPFSKVGQTHIPQAATFAMGTLCRSWRVFLTEKPVHGKDRIAAFFPKFRRKSNDFSPARLSIKKRTARNTRTQHLLQTSCLGAKLQTVTIIGLGFAAFVFHRIGLP